MLQHFTMDMLTSPPTMVGFILTQNITENKSVIAQFEKRPEDYEPCDKNGNSLTRAKKASKAKEAAEAQEASKAKGTK